MLEEGRGRAREPETRNLGWNADRSGGMEACRLVVVANKADLLPKQASAARLQDGATQGWVKRRIQQAGLPRPETVHLVSSVKFQGIGNLLGNLKKAAGAAGDVWVVGAQNAGKSSLINAMRRCVGLRSQKRDVTTAPLPGTTLGMLRIDGIMDGRSRMFDTPGVPQRHQLSSRLCPDEVQLLLPRGRLVPRTFRAAAGQTVFVGGVARLDVVASSCSSLYLTVWASSDIPCHFGKTDTAEERYGKMLGTTLIPPVGSKQKWEMLGALLPADVDVEGNDFKTSSMDVAIAGLGWIGVGLKGRATLKIWTYQGIEATVREALLPDLASDLERPGLGNRTQKAPRAVKRGQK